MSDPGARSEVTPRALLIGLALIPLNAYWIMVAELRWYVILTLNPLFVTPVFLLLVLIGINALLNRLQPRWRLSVAELLTVYVMVAISCTVATLDYIVNWIRMIGWGAWAATPENKWEQIVFPHMPRWTLLWDEEALRGLFEGGSLYTRETLSAWAPPLIAWVTFMLLSFGLMLCLSAIVRKAWIADTKLSFPVVRLPLAMAGVGSPGFFRSRALWVGVGLTVASGMLNGLSQFYPTIPHFQTAARFPTFTEPPLNLIGWTPTSLYPFAIGLAYFVPLDVLFSCWFFYLFGKLQRVAGYALGVTNLPGFPFPAEQAIGAWMTYALLLLYITRNHWRQFIINLRRPGPSADADELLPHRIAVGLGLALAALLLVFWRAIGMSVLPAAIALGMYYLVSLAITRIRAETGAPHDVVTPEPMNVFSLVGPRLLGRGDIVGAGLSHWFWRFNRSHAMPTQMEALKIWHDAGLSARSLALPMILATAASCLAAPWAALHIGYRDGLVAKCMGFKDITGREMWSFLARMLGGGGAVEWTRIGAVAGGSGLVLLLWASQSRLSWLWFHPLGYCIGPSLNWVWFPFVIAWALKAAVVRYGGEKWYRRLMPFFLGLVLGDYIVGAAWALATPLLNTPGYHIFH